MSREYYVYVYKYPNGDIFYVGKGQNQRCFMHLDRVIRNIRDCNEGKQAVIRSILTQGLEPIIEIVARFADEQEAYMYEWALIHLTAYSGLLTNQTTIVYVNEGFPNVKKIPPMILPEITSPFCIWGANKMKVFHQIASADELMQRLHIRAETARKLIEDGYTSSWVVINCSCDM